MNCPQIRRNPNKSSTYRTLLGRPLPTQYNKLPDRSSNDEETELGIDSEKMGKVVVHYSGSTSVGECGKICTEVMKPGTFTIVLHS